MDKPIAWSHSALESFETCPHKHYRTRIIKDVEVNWDNEPAKWGREVHAAMDRRLRIKAKLPTNMEMYEQHAAKLEAVAKITGMEIKTELQLAITQQLQPCNWKDWNHCWARAAIDVGLLHPEQPEAMVWDWKTGKRKTGAETDQQLAICALMIFLHYPHVHRVHSGYLWLVEGAADRMTFTRDSMKAILGVVLPKVRALTDAHLNGDWPTRPSGLCQKYCEVHDCKFNGAYKAP